MTSLFVKLLNLSISAGILVLVVFIFRFFLKMTSRRAVCLLWLIVALRLVIPFSFESSFSIMPSGEFIHIDQEVGTDANLEEDYYISDKNEGFGINHTIFSEELNNSVITSSSGNDDDIIALPTQIPEKNIKDSEMKDNGAENSTLGNGPDNIQNNIDSNTEVDYYISSTPKTTLANSEDNSESKGMKEGFVNSLPGKLGFKDAHFWEILAYVWLLGVVVIMGYTLIGYVRMKAITSESIPYVYTDKTSADRGIGAKKVFICDGLGTAFIFGIFKPQIYIPGTLDEKQMDNVIAHENMHLSRHDHVWKLIGFFLLVIYWFNPLMWLAYAFLCKDIEFACDEQVISDMDAEEIREYSNTLLFCSTNMHFMYGCPLAFGEVAVKDRVKAALSYKKPLFWLIILALFLAVIVGILFFTKPSEDLGETQDTSQNIDYVPAIMYEFDCAVEEIVKINEKENTSTVLGYRVKVLEDGYGIFNPGDIVYVEGNYKEFRPSTSKMLPDELNPGDRIFVYHFGKDQTGTGVTAYNIEFMSRQGIINVNDIAEEFNAWGGNDRYYRMNDGTYWYNGNSYKSRIELTGRVPNAAKDTTYVYLSNKEDITFEQAWKDQYSDDLKEHFKPEEAILVEIENRPGRTLLNEEADMTSVKALLDTISTKYQYRLVSDFDFTYVIPNGVEFSSGFGWSSGLYFYDYVNTWPEFSSIEKNEDLTKPWHDDKKSENGYFVISTSEEYNSQNELNSGLKLYFKDDYVHIFFVDDMGEEYMWSYRMGKLRPDETVYYTPNMYSIRRIFFNKYMYDYYVKYCAYDSEISNPGIYNFNRGYTVDLDGDGKDEKLFVANCGWINYPEPENNDDFRWLPSHSSDPSYNDYYGDYPKCLIYINGELQNGEDDLDRIHDYFTYGFAITDIDVNDGRYEILVNDDADFSDVFHIWKNGKLSSPKLPGANLLRYSFNYDETKECDVPEGVLLCRFNGDGTFMGEGTVKLEDYGYRWGSDNILWQMDGDGNLERCNEVYDIPYSYDEKHLAMNSSEEYANELRNRIQENPSAYFWELQVELDVTAEPDTSSKQTYMPKGYVLVDKTDGISKIHITYINNTEIDNVFAKGTYTGVPGWIDLAHLDSYVRNYDSTGLTEARSHEFLDLLFSNINHAG